MMTPKKVDILGELLTSTDEETFPGLAELSSLLAGPENPAPPEPRLADAPAKEKSPLPKKKVTHYLSRHISEALDRVLPQVRDMVPEQARKKVSKSRLVDSSLRLLLREFEEKGKESLLVRQYLHIDRDPHGS